jgi:hypothetical protein
MSSHPHFFLELPLAFGNRRARVEHDPDQLAQQVLRGVQELPVLKDVKVLKVFRVLKEP